MRLLVPALSVVVGLCHTASLAQSPPIDLATLPAEIKTLKWKEVDVSKLSSLDQCRELLLLNDVLDELGAQMTAEADLMSSFIDAKNLGTQFAAQPPVADPAPLTLTNAQQMGAALLQGPMAKSSYTSQLTGTAPDVLAAYQQMYLSTCQWKWSALANNRLRVRSMARFLDSTGKMSDYVAWVPGEVQKRAQLHQEEIARRNEAAVAQQQQKQEQRIQQQEQQLQAQQAQLKQQQQAVQQMQQSLCAAQQNQNQSQPNAQINVNGGYPGWYYGGLAGLGTAAWYRDGAYLGAAGAATDARFAGWHGVGGFRR